MSKHTHSMKKKSRLRLLHQYYAYTGFYKFLGDATKKIIPVILVVVSLLLAVNFFVIDAATLLDYVNTNYSNTFVILLFFISESILGIIPPELFIAWSDKTSNPLLYLTLIALASYAGGVVSYYAGVIISKFPAVSRYLDTYMAKHTKHLRKWGGILIGVSALLPLPYSVFSIAAGMIRYRFVYFLLVSILRLVRFYIFAAFIFRIV